MWVTLGSELRNDKYTKKLKEMRGKDKDPLIEPLDAEVCMLAGQGMRNGRLYIDDGSVDTTSVLSLTKLRATRTSSNPGIETCPQPSLVSFSDIQARLNEETRKREEAELREQQVQATLDRRQQQMAQQQEMLSLMAAWFTVYESHLAALSGTSGVPPLASFPPLPTFSFGLVPPSTGSNNVSLAPSTNIKESPVTPTTGSHPSPHPHTLTTRRVL